MSHSGKLIVATALFAVVVWPGCHAPKIRERRPHATPAPAWRATEHAPTRPGGPDTSECEYDPLRARVEGPGPASAGDLLGLAERAEAIGDRHFAVNPARAIPWYREAAAFATFSLDRVGTDVSVMPIERAVADHNRAVEKLLRCAGSGHAQLNPSWRSLLAAQGVTVRHGSADQAGLDVQELWNASDFRVKNLPPVGRSGIGVPLIAVSYHPNRVAGADRFLPERLRLPATAIFRPAGRLAGGEWRGLPAQLVLHDPAHEAITPLGVGPRGVALASDLTTPLAHQFLDSPLTQLTWGGLLRPEAYASVSGIFMGGPYRAGKIPVLFVHGLWSSPGAWLRMVNGLQADPVLRERYQFWYAYYPTGDSLMISSSRVREALHQLRDQIDPGHSDAALDQMVVVGHSLGGVMSKQFLLTSGDELERGLFTRPFVQVTMSPQSRSTLSRYLFFEREPSIRRAIFIAAPHRGSNMANRLIGRVSSGLVRRPGAVAALHAEIMEANGVEVFQPWFRRRPPSSIDNLESESPVLEALERLPIPADVPYHSIVAALMPNAPPDRWTDGVVKYESAHLDGAASEVLIRGSHLVNETDEATAEVQRILRIHAEEQPVPPG